MEAHLVEQVDMQPHQRAKERTHCTVPHLNYMVKNTVPPDNSQSDLQSTGLDVPPVCRVKDVFSPASAGCWIVAENMVS